MTSNRVRTRSERRSIAPVRLAGFLLPGVAIYTLFMAWPLLDSLWSALYAQGADGYDTFVGLGNFVTLFTDPLFSVPFWRAFGHTLVFLGIFLLVQNPIAIGLAALLSNRLTKASGFFRNTIFLPTTLSIVIAGWVWSLILSPVWGISGSVLGLIGMEWIVPPEGWQGSEDWALIVVALVGVWQFLGLPMILYLAAFLDIDDSLLDSAAVDGATGWQAFWRIRLPLILPVVGVVSTLMFISNFVAFDHVYVMQGPLAPPDFATDILGTFFHRTAFGTSAVLGNPTMGTTVAAVMFLFMLVVVSFVVTKVQPRLERT